MESTANLKSRFGDQIEIRKLADRFDVRRRQIHFFDRRLLSLGHALRPRLPLQSLS